MKQRKKNAFTLIELVAVLVIMAIIALIVTPLVMSIIRKARISADKRSIDAYGRSIELAIAGYLMDTGDFPTSIEQLTIEYTGEEVVCSTTQLNTDSSIYLAGCTVGGRSTGYYTYGEDKTPPAPTYTAYSVGDQVTYNSINYYVIKDSDTTEDSVTLLKADPLSAEDITTYSAGTGANTDGNGEMAFSTNNNYETSYVKTTVDAWKVAQAPTASEARLITIGEVSNLGYSDTCVEEGICEVTENVPNWIYNDNYLYWTMSQNNDSTVMVWGVSKKGILGNDYGVTNNNRVVRPVIVLPKSALSA